MEKRLIPYSVHLREDIYLKLKEFAKDRKATALVRDAITMIVEGDDAFNGGYNKAVRDIMAVIEQDQWCKAIGVDQVTIAEHLNKTLEQMILPQQVNP
jgi:hypothetical protein